MSIAFADETIKAMFTEVLMTFASLPNSEWRKIYDKKQTNNKQLLVEAINRQREPLLYYCKLVKHMQGRKNQNASVRYGFYQSARLRPQFQLAVDSMGPYSIISDLCTAILYRALKLTLPPRTVSDKNFSLVCVILVHDSAIFILQLQSNCHV